MKTSIQQNRTSYHTAKQQSDINKEALYNLLFSGRISLKEYLGLLKNAVNS